MAIVAVTADNTRINAADSTTNWGNDGGGGGIANEVDITYQNAIAQSRKISTTRIGRDYTHGSSTNTTATGLRHMLAKVVATNPNVLLTRTSPALGLKIGSSSSAYHEVYLFGNDNYPPRGGWQLVPVSVNVTAHQHATTGSPTLTAVTYWSVLADFSAGSKAENVAIDAIDVGAGLNLVGGDGANPDGSFDDFVTFDEGTVANRYGYVFTEGTSIFANGQLSIGRNTTPTAVATVFQSTGEKVTWKNGWAETGYHRLLIDLGSATTDVDLVRANIDSEGEDGNTLGGIVSTTGEDTRLIVEVVGTSGTCNFTDSIFNNLQDMILTSPCVLTGCDITTEALTQSSAEIDECTIRTTSLTSVATIQDPVFGASDLHDTAFVQAGFGHAVEISATGTYAFTGLSWTGYGADTTDSAAVDVTAASGTVTINWSGGNAPTYKTAGATVSVQSVITITLTNLANGTEVRVYETGTNTEADGIESVTGGQFAASLQSSTAYDIVVIFEGKIPVRIENISFTANQNLDVNQSDDANYLNP